MAKAEEIIESKAKLGIGEALYSFGNSLYKHIMMFQNEGTKEFQHNISPQTIRSAPEILSLAAEGGVSSAYFLLGIMAIEGKIIE